MVANGLEYSIRKKFLDTQSLKYMAQLAIKVRLIERLKAEKTKPNKYPKKGKVAYVATDECSSDENESGEEIEVNVAELQPGPPYVCKLLKPSNGKNPVETENNGRAITKNFTFDITKCDEIFDLLVADGQIVVPWCLKNPPLEQKKKRGFCKYHNFQGFGAESVERWQAPVWREAKDAGRH